MKTKPIHVHVHDALRLVGALTRSPAKMSKLDPRLSHRVREWAQTQPSGLAAERDADAIVAWLRAQRGSEYARKPADGLRKQVVRCIAQLRTTAAAAAPASAPATAADAATDGTDATKAENVRVVEDCVTNCGAAAEQEGDATVRHADEAACGARRDARARTHLGCATHSSCVRAA